jgi:hypothetical protein
VVREVLDEAQHQHLAVGGGQPVEGRGDVGTDVGADLLVSGGRLDLDGGAGPVEQAGVPPLAPADVVAGVGDDAVQPGVEVVVAVEAVEVAEGPQERLLHGVLGQGGVAEAAHGVAVHGPVVAQHDLAERVVVAGAVLLDEGSVVQIGDECHGPRPSLPCW